MPTPGDEASIAFSQHLHQLVRQRRQATGKEPTELAMALDASRAAQAAGNEAEMEKARERIRELQASGIDNARLTSAPALDRYVRNDRA